MPDPLSPTEIEAIRSEARENEASLASIQQEREQLIEKERHTRGVLKAMEGDLRARLAQSDADRLSLIAALREYGQHKASCPQAYDERWINILHNEQHFDDESMENCHFAACRAWCKSAEPPCSCGLADRLKEATK